MNAFQVALRRDIHGEIDKAASEYENCILSGDAPLDAYLNLAVLYWECTQQGFSRAHKLPVDFSLHAANRYEMLLHEANKIFENHLEVRFWKLYFDFVTLGEPPFDAECRLLVVNHSLTLVPYFYLYSSSNGQQYQQEVSELLRLCKLLPIIKNQYIISVIEGTALRTNTLKGKWHDSAPSA